MTLEDEDIFDGVDSTQSSFKKSYKYAQGMVCWSAIAFVLLVMMISCAFVTSKLMDFTISEQLQIVALFFVSSCMIIVLMYLVFTGGVWLSGKLAPFYQNELIRKLDAELEGTMAKEVEAEERIKKE